MSHRPKKPHRYYLATGVIKFDYKCAGYPDVMRLAKEWSQDENFRELIVRKVSDENFGIQFVYAAEGVTSFVIDDLRRAVVGKFGKGIYAWDIDEGTSDSFEDCFHGILLLRPLQVNEPDKGQEE